MKQSNRLLWVLLLIALLFVIGTGFIHHFFMPKEAQSDLKTSLSFSAAKEARDTQKMVFNAEKLKHMKMTGVFDIKITPGDTPRVIVASDAETLKKLEIKNEGDTLRIAPKKDNLNLKDVIEVQVTTKRPLESLNLTGEVRLTADALAQDHLALKLEGYTQCQLSGKVESLKVYLDGFSKFNAKDLISENIKFKGEGSIQAKLHAEKSLKVSALGNTHVVYSGKPTLDESISGVSSIKPSKK